MKELIAVAFSDAFYIKRHLWVMKRHAKQKPPLYFLCVKGNAHTFIGIWCDLIAFCSCPLLKGIQCIAAL